MYIVFSTISPWESFILGKILLLEIQYIIFLQALNSSSESVSHSVVSNSLQPHGLKPSRLLLFIGFSRQEYWSGLPFPSQGDLPDPGIKPTSSAVAGGFSNLLSHQRSPSDSLQNTKCQLSGPALKKGLPAPIYMSEYTVG